MGAFLLAAATPDDYRLASWLCHPHLADDYFAGQGARNNGGIVQLGDAPGLGIAIDEQTLPAPTAVYS